MTVVLSITPTSFSASSGKLDSGNNYLYEDPAGDFFMPLGRTIDFGYGNFRIAYAGEIYDQWGYGGSFTEPTVKRLKANGS